MARRGRWLGMVLAVVAGLALWTAPAPAQIPLTTTTKPPTPTTKPPTATTAAPGAPTTAKPKPKATTTTKPVPTTAPAPSTTLLSGTPDAGATPTTVARPRVIPSGQYHPLGLLITVAGLGLAGLIFTAQWILTSPKRRAGFTL